MVGPRLSTFAGRIIVKFSWLLKKLQRLGSWVVRPVSSTDIADAASGFRTSGCVAAVLIAVLDRAAWVAAMLLSGLLYLYDSAHCTGKSRGEQDQHFCSSAVATVHSRRVARPVIAISMTNSGAHSLAGTPSR